MATTAFRVKWSKPDAHKSQYGELLPQGRYQAAGPRTFKVEHRADEDCWFAFELRCKPFPHWYHVGSAATDEAARDACERFIDKEPKR